MGQHEESKPGEIAPSTAAAPATVAVPAGHPHSRPHSHSRQWRLLLVVLFLSVLSYFLVSHFLFMAVVIRGTSMSPTLHDGERCLLYRCTYLVREPRKGEIVVLRDPEDHGLSIKRIVGLPGEVVEFRADGLYINNAKLSEPYLVSHYLLSPDYQPTRPVRLGRNDYFVLGDNRNNSADSRTYGPVSRNAILGVISR